MTGVDTAATICHAGNQPRPAVPHYGCGWTLAEGGSSLTPAERGGIMKNCIASWVPNAIDISQDPVKGWAVLKFAHDDDYVELMFPKSAVGPLLQQIQATLEQNDKDFQAEQDGAGSALN
jgi:hypothetical protein